MKNTQLAEKISDANVDLTNAEDVYLEIMKTNSLRQLAMIFSKEQIYVLLNKLREVFEENEFYERCAVVRDWIKVIRTLMAREKLRANGGLSDKYFNDQLDISFDVWEI